MIEIKGKYNTASIYTDSIEDEAYKQVLNLMNQKFAEGSKFAIMPDCHAGSKQVGFEKFGDDFYIARIMPDKSMKKEKAKFCPKCGRKL